MAGAAALRLGDLEEPGEPANHGDRRSTRGITAAITATTTPTTIPTTARTKLITMRLPTVTRCRHELPDGPYLVAARALVAAALPSKRRTCAQLDVSYHLPMAQVSRVRPGRHQEDRHRRQSNSRPAVSRGRSWPPGGGWHCHSTVRGLYTVAGMSRPPSTRWRKWQARAGRCVLPSDRSPVPWPHDNPAEVWLALEKARRRDSTIRACGSRGSRATR